MIREMRRLVPLLLLLALEVGATHATAYASSSAVDARQVVNRLKAAGLPIGRYKAYSASTDPNKLLGRPGQYVSKANFHDERLTASRSMDVSSGGSVETFKSVADAKNRFRYIKAVTESSPLFLEYHWLEGRVLLRVASDLTPTQAKRYEAILRRLY